MRPLTTASIALLTIGSVDSIRNLPAAALAGNALPFYFSLAFLLFLLPCAIICSWLSYQSDDGILGWVRTGLGAKMGLTSVWLQWMQNILIYPTFLAFIAGACLYCIHPSLASHPIAIFVIINGLIWMLTFINENGIQLSSRVNAICTSIGLLLPFLILLLIGGYTIWQDPQCLRHLPNSQEDGLTSLTAIMLSFCGLEIAAVHTQGATQHAFKIATIIAVIVIFITMLMGAITIAVIIPWQSMNFVSDIPNLFQIFFTKVGYPHWATMMTVLVIIGSIGCANNWIMAPVKGLSIALDMPINRLLRTQALLISIISGFFLFFASIKASYWYMLTLATQMYIFLYALMYVSAMKLSWSLNKMTIYLVTCIGLVGLFITFAVSMRAPASIGFAHQFAYKFSLIAMNILLIMPVWYIYRKQMPEMEMSPS